MLLESDTFCIIRTVSNTLYFLKASRKAVDVFSGFFPEWDVLAEQKRAESDGHAQNRDGDQRPVESYSMGNTSQRRGKMSMPLYARKETTALALPGVMSGCSPARLKRMGTMGESPAPMAM